MPHVYILQSTRVPPHTYIGRTRNLAERLRQHNAGRSPHTAKYRPWKLAVAIWFADVNRANAFELYLKSGSGRAFIKRHLV